jgi:hypothetical protein
MNVVDGSDAHHGIPLMDRRKARIEKNTVLVQPEMEGGRFPLVSNPPFRAMSL